MRKFIRCVIKLKFYDLKDIFTKQRVTILLPKFKERRKFMSSFPIRTRCWTSKLIKTMCLPAFELIKQDLNFLQAYLLCRKQKMILIYFLSCLNNYTYLIVIFVYHCSKKEFSNLHLLIVSSIFYYIIHIKGSKANVHIDAL